MIIAARTMAKTTRVHPVTLRTISPTTRKNARRPRIVTIDSLHSEHPQNPQRYPGLNPIEQNALDRQILESRAGLGDHRVWRGVGLHHKDERLGNSRRKFSVGG